VGQLVRIELQGFLWNCPTNIDPPSAFKCDPHQSEIFNDVSDILVPFGRGQSWTPIGGQTTYLFTIWNQSVGTRARETLERYPSSVRLPREGIESGPSIEQSPGHSASGGRDGAAANSRPRGQQREADQRAGVKDGLRRVIRRASQQRAANLGVAPGGSVRRDREQRAECFGAQLDREAARGNERDGGREITRTPGSEDGGGRRGGGGSRQAAYRRGSTLRKRPRQRAYKSA
jgi:hypothetical protein